METITIRIRPHTYGLLESLARERQVSVEDALDYVVDAFRRHRMLDDALAAYAAVAADPAANALWQAEIAVWDATLADGLAEYPDHPHDW